MANLDLEANNDDNAELDNDVSATAIADTEDTELGETAESTGEESQNQEDEFEMVVAGEEQDSQTGNNIGISAKNLAKLRSSRREARSENEDLKARIAELEARTNPQSQHQAHTTQPQVTAFPDRYDHDTDEQFQAAVQSYIANQVSATQQQGQQTAAQQQAQQVIDESMGGHYKRAGDLVQKLKVEVSDYEQAEQAVRQSLGDLAYEQLVDSVGDGSEKLTYHWGKNPAKLQQAAAELQAEINRTGGAFKFVAQSARLADSIQMQSKTRQISQAPAADPGLPSSGGNNASDAAILKKVEKLTAGRDRTEWQKYKRQLVGQGKLDLLKANGFA